MTKTLHGAMRELAYELLYEQLVGDMSWDTRNNEYVLGSNAAGRRILSILDQYKEEWQPIETAPYDELILVHGEGVTWVDHIYGCSNHTFAEFAVLARVSHWMPLPAAPEMPE
jgi:hypothetical protein